MKNPHRKFTARQRFEIVLEGLAKDASIAEVCRRHQISTTLFYHWRDQFFKHADRLFAPNGKPADQRIAELEAEAARLKAVVAEITMENLELKKTPGASPIMPSSRRSSGR